MDINFTVSVNQGTVVVDWFVQITLRTVVIVCCFLVSYAYLPSAFAVA